ncbi:ribosome-associated protein [Alkalithermobacter thermoalcaliphilus JW-YL-7 = DSM 7308]|uniref:Ribosomal silencing factor RsfS n=1 Tax=Alkalithermobacter thermoalcaliphilus JW-YL-7 = DSM 7308 TaxID=1121328 RepID=A0A150FRA5_CLOPD|nr:iojap-like protein [[Clostridium] paradoxum JW-YL-7 = DSM 7308]SHL02735.1 ribosome-associated protein [[Clostridium] paradoxum JW-YL-7 = DSM 7308]
MVDNVEQLVKKVYEAIDDKKGEDIAVLELKNITSIADYFIIASATSERQVKAIADNVEEKLQEEGVFVKRKDGQNSCRWILLDYGDFMVHIFHSEERAFYDLERLWKDAPYKDIQSL